MSEFYKKTFRGYLIDHHSPAPPTVTLSSLDISEYEAFFDEANISSLMLYTKDHWGYSYFNTEIGTRHPALKLDFVGEISKILKRKNIEFNAYYCLEYETLAPMLHPEWTIRDALGNPVILKGRMAKWGMPCYETGYRDYVLGQLKEIVTKYHPDSLFLDIFGKTLCYCDSCRKKFKNKYGYDLPENGQTCENELSTLNFGEKGRAVNEFLEDCAADMLESIISLVKSIDSQIKVTINFAALYPKKIRDMLDYQFTEPWAGNWLSAAYSRDTAPNQYPQLGPGDVSEVYNYRPDSIYELAAAEIAAQGCRVFMYSGSQHVDGTLEHTEAHKVGKAYKEIEKFEKYLIDRKIIADIAIVQSDSSSEARVGAEVVANSIGRCKKTNLHRQAVLGAMKLCDYSKYSWCIVPEQELTRERLCDFKCVILAGLFHVTDEMKENLTAFIKAGGKIVADSKCGLYEKNGKELADFPLSHLFGCNYLEDIADYSAAEWGGYINQNKNEIWKYTPKTLPPMGDLQYKIANNGCESLGEIVHPCTALTDTAWVNWWCPPPKDKATKSSAIVKNTVACGESIYIAFDFFASVNKGLNLNANIFSGIIESLLPAPTVFLKTDSKNIVEFVAYKRAKDIIIHNISCLAKLTDGDCPPIDGGTILLNKSVGNLKAAIAVYPTVEALKISELVDCYEILLPKVSIHSIVQIEIY